MKNFINFGQTSKKKIIDNIETILPATIVIKQNNENIIESDDNNKSDSKIKIKEELKTSIEKNNNFAKEKFNNIFNKFKLKVYPNLEDNVNPSMTIYCWNINGFRKMVDLGIIENFISRENPDFLCLNETRIDDILLKKQNYDKLFRENYLSYWNCSNVKKGYSGVAIFTKYKPIKVKYGLGIELHDQEGRVLTLEYKSFYLICVYTPNSGSNRLEYRVKSWDIDFREYIKNLESISNKNIIICGDLNVAHTDYDMAFPEHHYGHSCFTPEEQNNMGNLLQAGYVDTFRHLYPYSSKYTWFGNPINIRKNLGVRLDYIIINKDSLEKLINSEILTDYQGSDHVPIKLTYKI